MIVHRQQINGCTITTDVDAGRTVIVEREIVDYCGERHYEHVTLGRDEALAVAKAILEGVQ